MGSLLVPGVSAKTAASELQGTGPVESLRGVNSNIVIDTDATGGYEGDYVVIYNPSTSSSTSYSTGTMTGLIQTSVNTNANTVLRSKPGTGMEQPFKIDVDSQMAEAAKTAKITPPTPTRASYSVGSTKTFSIYSTYSPTGSGSVQFKCLYVGQHCYIWTPTSSSNNTYPLDTIDSSFAKLAADEFDSKFDLMQSSFGNHTNGSNGDGKLHILYYNINDGWQPGQGYIAGFFYQVDISNNGLPILNIDTSPGVYYKNTSTGAERATMEYTYNTMVHEYQHLINYSNTSGMSTWLNECFSAAAEEICYPGSSVVSRIQSWENYYYSDNNDWLNPPSEFQYQSSYNLHNGYSLYAWNNNLDDILALYSQVSFFAQYLYTRFGNTIYRQISNKFSSSDVTAITNATGVSCADLARDFRVAVTANAAQDQYNGIYGFKVQNGYDPANYYNVQNPYDLLAPIVFTGSSCSIKGGGAITVKPVNGVYNPPSGANSNLKYIGIKVNPTTYTVTAVSNNTSYGTVSVNGTTITAVPKTGYYAEGYTVTSGTASVTQNGNVFTVTPSSDCTVRINFAAKPQYTVTYKVLGSTLSTATAYVNETVTLPASVSGTPDGWTFIGWSAAQMDETAVKPAYYAPGASYTVTANATLYALYTRTEGSGEVVYELLSAAPSDWAGSYVFTYGTASSSMYLMKGVSPSSNGAQIESTSNAVSFSSSGVSLSGTTLSNVSDSYVFTLEPQGSYYTVKSVSAGSYLGVASNSYLAAYTSYNSSYCNWTPGVGTSASSMKNASSGSYPYLGFSTNSKYFWTNSSVNTTVRLWKGTQAGTVYYATNPSATHTHTAAAAVQENYVAPTCTAAGSYDEVVYCSSCGEEMSHTHKTVAALGHNAGSPVQENYVAPTETVDGGYDTVTYCTRCSAELSRTHTTLPATGPTVYYTVSFSVPAAVTAPASQTVAAGGSVTLPAAGAPDGYAFVGWVTAACENVTVKPTVLTGSYTPAANVTLYALYSFTEGTGGDTVYQLADAFEDGGKYILIASGAISGTSGKAVGNTAVSNSRYLTPVAVTVNSDDTVTAASSNLAKVLWVASGSSTNGYTLYNEAAGKYMGLDSSEYLAPTASGLAWTYTSNQYLDNKVDSEGYYYLSYSSSSTVRYTTSKSGTVLKLYKETSTGTTYYTTVIGETSHTHTAAAAVQENYVAPTCTAAGSYDEVVYCSSCGEEMSRTHNPVAALGHNAGTPVQENYVAATETTDGGYDTVTYCTRCNAELSREHTTLPATGATTYTVSFTVPSGVAAVASMSAEANGYITLPTAGAPSGYTFLGWVTEAVNNSTAAPANILTGSYQVTGNITLKALYSYTASSGSETGYELLSSAPSDWAGNYVITYGTNTSSLYVLKGLSGNTKYESASAGGSILYSNTGMSYADGYMTGVSSAYVWNIAATGSYYTIRNASTGTYLGNYSSYLYSRSSYSSSYCRWTLSCSSGNMTVKSTRSTSYPYLSFSSNNYFMVNSSAPTGLYFWKETTVGGTVTYYTT